MTNGIDVTVPAARNPHYLLIAKAIIIVAIGAVTGYFFHVSEMADYQEGLAMTSASYAANFAKYRAELLEASRSAWVDVGFVIVLCGVWFAAYEGLSYFTAWILHRVRGASRAKTSPPAPTGAQSLS